LEKKSQFAPGPRAPAAAHSDEDLLRAFLEHIPAGVYFKDRESRFVLISRSLADRFGLTDPADAIGKTDFDIFSDEHAKQAFTDEQEIIRNGRAIVDKEEKETWPDGRENWVLTTKLPLKDHSGRVIGTMGVSRDITERKRAEREIEEYRTRLEDLVAARTEELVRVNRQLEHDIAARRQAEEELAIKAQELARTNKILENLSLVDDLTGLYNRKGFLALAEHRVKLSYRTGEPFSIAFVDLDHLKQINDSFGHQEGDRALIDTANILRDCFRESDILARLGGDEFVIFVAEADMEKIAGRIHEKLAALETAPGRSYRLSFSMGIVVGRSPQNHDVESLLKQADVLMYEQKRAKALAPGQQRDQGVTPTPGPRALRADKRA
jgi:diguanylate cyclase (GGDEF)-like protein/PAS domain S-box-containing protein